MVDRVQVIKWESTAGGGSTDEQFPDSINPNQDAPEVRAIFFQNDTSEDETVETSRDASNNMTFKDGVVEGTKTLSDLLAGGGITPAQHKALRHLIHFIDDGPADGFASGAYREILPSADPFPTSIIWWESSSKLKKIVEKTITRSGGGVTVVTPTPIVWDMYDTDGTTKLVTISDAITYSTVFETNRTRTITVH